MRRENSWKCCRRSVAFTPSPSRHYSTVPSRLVIIDLTKFLASERPHWAELEALLNGLEANPDHELDLARARRLHYLYERASADLGKLATFASEPDIRRYLEGLVARAYGEIHETREKPHRLAPWHWFCHTFPQAFRRNVRAFWLSVAITLAGCAFGGLAVAFDPESKSVLMPFSHLQGDPAKRVVQEEKAANDRLAGHKAGFSTMLMTHNTKVSILAMALGMTWAIGTIVLLFYNGVILGAVAVDYALAGQTKFLLGWLLPHGSFEIPAILIAGQAGLLLGGALIGGVALMLVWAGFIEAFLSQYHEPASPYSLKIGFGAVELVLLTLFLARSGREKAENHE